MQVLAVTILISLCLAGIFVISFTLECRRKRNGTTSPEHAALLPFDDEDDNKSDSENKKETDEQQ